MKSLQIKMIETVTLVLGLTILTACGGGGSGGGTGGGDVADITAPVFTSSSTISVNENQTSALTLIATDAATVTYEVNSALFTVDATTGVVTFVTAPNYEKQDSYGLTVKATDVAGNIATQTVTITILDVAESVGKFVITVKTDNTGDTSDVEFQIPTNTGVYPAGYSYHVDCDNDGENETTEPETGNYICEYDSAGTYTIAIEGEFPQIYFNNSGDKDKLISVDQWGTNVWKSMVASFRGCSNLAGQASDNPDLSEVTSLNTMFHGADSFNQDIGAWDVSNVTNMFMMFRGATAFNQNIGGWNVSNVTDMGGMFMEATAFNQDISAWDVSSVVSMHSMFLNATAFDQKIGAWQPYAVRTMDKMFDGVTLSVANYRLLLEGWDFKKVNLQDNVTFSGGNSSVGCTGIGDVECLAAQVARQALRTDKGWIITDGD